MVERPRYETLVQTLAAAATAHHEYEREFLDGFRDAQWCGFYAAYVLGRLGPFATPSALARWLEDTPLGGDWSAVAARHVIEGLGGYATTLTDPSQTLRSQSSGG